jgi:hypothetical protein
MKTQEIARDVQRSGVTNETQFTIKGTAKAFDILSSGLYSDKIQAIVRELACNAYDAHVAADKKDVPIEIHLPTQLDPTFYVKDFGIGLDHEGVTKLYTTYFESTKQESNDFIGALGLGSKSPFSYAAQFIVEARYEGVRRVYTAFKNEFGLPSITLMGEQATDESNGITVSMSVKPEDTSKFETAAKKALMYFTPRPKVVGRSSFKPYDLKHTISGDEWKIRESEYYAYMRGPYVVQGFVAYPVDSNILKEHKLSKHAASVCGLDLDVFVNIGDVEVAASREALSYDKRTITNLVSKMETIADQMRRTFEKEIENCATYWDAMQKVDHFDKHGNDKFKTLFRNMHESKPFTWKGKKIQNHHTIDLSAVADMKVHTCRVGSGRRTKVINTWWPSYETKEFSTTVHSSMTVVVDNGQCKHPRWMLEEHLQHAPRAANGTPAAFVIDAVVKGTYNQKEVDAIVAALGHPKVYYVHEMTYEKPKAPRSPTKRRGLTTKMKWTGFTTRMTGRYWCRRQTINRTFSARTWAAVDVDMDVGGFYVATERHVIEFSGREMSYFDELLTAAKALGMIPKDDPIYGFNEKDRDQIKDNPKWVNLFDHLVCKFKEMNKDGKLTNLSVLDRFYQLTGWTMRDCFFKKWSNIDNDVLDGPLKQFMSKIASMSDGSLIVGDSTVQTLMTQLGVRDDIYDIAAALDTEWDAVWAKYPLMSVINWDSVGEVQMAEIVKYINSVEELNTLAQ